MTRTIHPKTEGPRTDPYHSRDAGRGEVADRVDPVVHGGASDGPLSQEELDRFDRDGFLTVEDRISAEEAASLRADADRVADAAPLDHETVIREPESDRVRSLFWIHRLEGPLARLCRDERVVSMARQILGSDVYFHQSRVNFKRPFVGKEFFWHSDFETWHMEDGMPRMRALSMSISLTDNNEFNGPLMVVPGSHRKYVRCVGETPDAHYRDSLRKQEIGVPSLEALERLVDEGGGIEAPKGRAGSITVFDCNTMHGSVSNLSPWPRTNLFLVFNSVENTLEAPFAGTRPRPEYIAERTFDPVQPVARESGGRTGA